MEDERFDETFKNWCQSTQAIVISLGLIVGGIWTAYVFKSRLQVENAQAELRRLELEIEQTRANLEALTEGRTSVQLSMEIEQLDSSPGDPRLLEVLVTARNVGTRDTMLVFPNRSPLILRRVEFSANGEKGFSEPLTFGLPTLV
ncbi:MAG TPA: hypothetical protein VKU40_09170, partial [Thermoanaerobaculia bacterium]|nr:hypothetical protein [Thermoanaerobaculia bacterium]